MNLPCASARSRGLEHRGADRLAGPHQMSDPSPKHCPPSPPNPAHRGRDRVSPKQRAWPFYDIGVWCAAIVVPASAPTSTTTTPLRRDQAGQLRHWPARRDGNGPFYFGINGASLLPSRSRYRTARFVLRSSTAAEIVPLPTRSVRRRRISSSPGIGSSVLDWPTVQVSSAISRVAERSLSL